VRNSWLGITAIAAKTIENIAGRVSASDPSLVDIPEVSALRPVGGRNDGARTAVIMLAATRRLVDAMRQGAESLPNGAGLHMGKAQVGSLTTGESKNFTAIGDVVNTAARLQSAAGANEILVSEKVYGALSGEKPQADRTTLDLKGKAEATDRLYLALANCRHAANGVSGCTTPH
jgi:adenylate cyclase